jgi:hypothetical protein
MLCSPVVSFNAINDFLIRSRAREIGALDHVAKAEKMRVGIDDPRYDSRSVQVDDAGRGAREHPGFGIGADEDHTATAGSERGHDWTRVVYGVDTAIRENEISPLRREHRWCERGQRNVA